MPGELVPSVLLLFNSNRLSHKSTAFLGDNSNRIFARIGPSTKKAEHFSVHKVTGDGRCLYFKRWRNRWLELLGADDVVESFGAFNLTATTMKEQVKGMAFNKGIALSTRGERDDAGAFKIVWSANGCLYPQSMRHVCLQGHRKVGWGTGSNSIAEYVTEFHKCTRKGKPRKAERLALQREKPLRSACLRVSSTNE